MLARAAALPYNTYVGSNHHSSAVQCLLLLALLCSAITPVRSIAPWVVITALLWLLVAARIVFHLLPHSTPTGNQDEAGGGLFHLSPPIPRIIEPSQRLEQFFVLLDV